MSREVETPLVWRTMLQEMPDAPILAECERRGWTVKRAPVYLHFCPCESCRQAARRLPFDGDERDGD